MSPATSIQGVRVFYGPFETEADEFRIAPAPKISINYSPIYANDHVIGMTNKITLNGFISTFTQQIELNSSALDLQAQFAIQADVGPLILSTESGDTGVTSENDRIIILEAAPDSVSTTYIRFTAFKNRNGQSGPYGLNEFRIFYRGVPVSLDGATITCNGYSGPPLSNLVDNDANTRIYPFYSPIVIQFDAGKLFDSYTLIYLNTTTDSPNYEFAPLRWTVESSDDGITWTMIDDQSLTDIVLDPPLPPGSPDTPAETDDKPIKPPKPPVGPDGDWTVTNAQDEKIRNIKPLSVKLAKLQALLSSNGNTLTIRDTNNDVVLTAIGGTLKSLSFDNGTNSWTQTAPFTAELEFNYINFFGENLACATYWADSAPSGMVDMDKYPLKSFTENFSISIDAESFNYSNLSDTGGSLRISNNSIGLSYNISATGKDYFKQNTDPPEFKPAWEIAKNFAQERLYDKVVALISGAIVMSDSGCLIPADATEDILNKLAHQTYGYEAYNETINCSFSELDGSFSATYNSTLKKKSDNGELYDANNAKHTITKTINHSRVNNSNARLLTSISVNGSIEGLILGGLIRADKTSFKLPRNGSLLIKDLNGATKYTNALNLWNQINGGADDDLSTQFKEVLGITSTSFGPTSCSSSPSVVNPFPRSFNLTRNFIDGTIDYDIEYNTDCTPANNERTQVVQNVTINFVDKTPVFAEFIIPASGTILQDIKTWTGKEVEFTITGRDEPEYKLDQAYTTLPMSWLATKMAAAIVPPTLSQVPQYDVEYDYLLKERSLNFNPIDGTYTMRFVYSCNTGCFII